MSISPRSLLFIAVLIRPVELTGNPMDWSMDDPAVNPFDVELIEPVPEEGEEVSLMDSEFCQQARAQRETHLVSSADLQPGGTLLSDDSFTCFTAEENLLYVASQEAQLILGPYAPWYLALSQENRERVAEACEVMGFETDTDDRSYQTCIENRYKELMGPYEDRYRRESMGYIGKRRQMAQQLVTKCNMALKEKRPLLPKDLTFPVAYYDRNLSAIPSWILEEGHLDHLWLERKGIIKAKDVMQAALGSQCPGNMVLWATYKAPEGISSTP